MQSVVGEVHAMTTTFRMLIVAGVLAAGAPASAACRWFGTQIDCGGVRIGTQAAAEPDYAGSLRLQSFQGSWALPGDRTVPARPLQGQNIGTDPGLCRQIGNETYCY
jgi:hypothetical protein